LIELLVVIAIIAILAAILFPVFAQAREKARAASCLSNLKQLSLGIHMYAQDYDETMPYTWGYEGTISGGSCAQRTPQVLRWFQDYVRPYIKNEQVYQCPSGGVGRQIITFGRSTPGAELTPNPLIRDYIANSILYAEDRGVVTGSTTTSGRVGPFTSNGGCGTEVVNLASIEDVSGTIAIVDGYMDNELNALCLTMCQNMTPAVPSFCEDDRKFKPWPGRIPRRHSEGFNAGFSDGHAKFLKNPRCGEYTRMAGD